MEDTMNISNLIKQNYAAMSKGHKRIADYILHNYDKAAYMTALQLGETVDVSESTVVRFAMNLGYDGYPHLQKALQDDVRNKLTILQRMEMTSDMDTATILQTVLKADINNLRNTLEHLNDRDFDHIVREICSARTIYIMGTRSAAPMAAFMGYYLSFFMDNVRVVTSGVNDILEQLVHIGEQDVVIAISFPRYSRRTLEAMGFASMRGACTVAITDSSSSPLAQQSKYVLTARSNIATFVDSLVAPFSVANALIVAIGLQKRGQVSENFAQLERIWDEYDVYLEKKREML